MRRWLLLTPGHRGPLWTLALVGLSIAGAPHAVSHAEAGLARPKAITAAPPYTSLVPTAVFEGRPDLVRQFDDLLSPRGDLSATAIAFWLGHGGLVHPGTERPIVDPSALRPVGDGFEPVTDRLKIDFGRRAGPVTIWSINTAPADDSGQFSKRFIVRQKHRGFNEDAAIERLNRTFPPSEWPSDAPMPRLARTIDVLPYERDDGATRSFTLQYAARGSDCLNDLSLEAKEKSRSCIDHIARSIGTMHSHFLADPTAPVSEWRTTVHNDLHASNVFFDPNSGRVTLIDLATMARGEINKDLHESLNRGVGLVLNKLIEAQNRLLLQMHFATTDEQYFLLQAQLERGPAQVDQLLKYRTRFMRKYTSAYPAELRDRLTTWLHENYNFHRPSGKPASTIREHWLDRIDEVVNDRGLMGDRPPVSKIPPPPSQR